MPPNETSKKRRRPRRRRAAVGPRGRVFGPLVRAEIIAAIERGASCRMAAELVQIDPRTLKSWRQRGRAGLAVLVRWEAEGEASERPRIDAYARFELEVSRALALRDMPAMDTMQRAARSDWRAAEAVLKMRRPGEFSEVVGHREVEIDDDGDTVDIADKLLRKLNEQAKRVRGEGDASGE